MIADPFRKRLRAFGRPSFPGVDPRHRTVGHAKATEIDEHVVFAGDAATQVFTIDRTAGRDEDQHTPDDSLGVEIAQFQLAPTRLFALADDADIGWIGPIVENQ